MDIKKSLNVALAKNGMSKTEFAEKLGVSRARLYAILNQKTVQKETLESVTSALDMKMSEFIALGE